MNENNTDLYQPVRIPLSLVAVWMVLYKKATGEIIQVMMQSPTSAGLLVTQEIGLCEISGQAPDMLKLFSMLSTHYVNTEAFYPKISERGPCPASLEGELLRNLPLPCHIEISAPLGGKSVYEERDFRERLLSFNNAGTYSVVVKSPRYLPGQFSITQENTSHGQN